MSASSSSSTNPQRVHASVPTTVLMLEGSLASCMAVIASNPMDVVKTRLQLQGELMKKGAAPLHYRGMFHACYVVFCNEGLRGLQKGLGAAFAWQTLQNGTRFGLYEPTKAAFGRVLPEGLATNLASAVFVGILGSIVANPVYLVKTRLQSASGGHAQVGVQHDYKGLLDGLSKIVSHDGVKGLMQGVPSAMMRTAVGSGVQLSSYDQTKAIGLRYTHLSPTDVRLHVMCSAVSAGLITIFMNPFDVLMTRCYNNPQHAYSYNPVSAFAKIIAAEGVGGLYKGATALWTRTAPHTILTFVFLEQIRQYRSFYLTEL